MTFKMKGHELPGIKQFKSSKMKDGRAASSALQQTDFPPRQADYETHEDFLKAKNLYIKSLTEKKEKEVIPEPGGDGI